MLGFKCNEEDDPIGGEGRDGALGVQSNKKGAHLGKTGRNEAVIFSAIDAHLPSSHLPFSVQLIPTTHLILS